MDFFRKDYVNGVKGYTNYILGADIGGTKSILGLFGAKQNKITLLYSLHYKSKSLKKIDDAIVHFVEYAKENFKIKISKACLAVAGVLNEKKDFARITNVHWNVDTKSISKKSGIKNISLINDFEAIGYGINSINRNDIKIIKNAKKIESAPIAVIGAGTGLGRCTLFYDKKSKTYDPIPTESGHSDLPVQNKEELELLLFIKKLKNIKNNVPFECVLSGPGLSNIFHFYSRKIQSKLFDEIKQSNFKPETISKHRKSDSLCKKTFEVFAKFYARFAKNCSMDCLPYGGLYIAGGIAPKNEDVFDKKFILEFENSFKHKDVLKRIPIFLVKNPDIGLIGAGFYSPHIKGKRTVSN